MANKKKDDIAEYKDRFESPIGVKNLVLPGQKKAKKPAAKKPTSKKAR